MPEDMPRERRVETTGESMNSSEITATFSAIDLTAVYDFLEKSFMLTDIVDLPSFFDLQYVDLLKEYEGKLVIDWGGSARMWHHKATTEKPIVAIESKNQKPFVGFENLILSFDELKEVVENDTDYELWQAAMAAVNAVYLIVDTKTGDRYVGSTYGYDGLLGRWSIYVATGGHGNNKGMISHLKSVNHSCHDLQFSVLQVLSKALPDNQIIDAETLWKKKLLTYEPFGMNQN